ncbi:outer membrane efflux protein [hydrothermal vent metagenome]|uniref:Outer membrane efflux protein n=1 Tax=hydrothermal vent metagenome TaxID=652676 RepID=A0A1W1BBP7_9ZZZZ
MKKIVLGILLSYPLLATSLPELVRIGIAKNTLIKKSKLDIEYAKEGKIINQANKLGSIDLVASYTHFNLPRTLAPLTPATMKDPVTASNVATTKDLFGTGVSYSVPLFTGFALTKDIEMSSISIEIARSKRELTQEQLVYNIRSLYLSILALKEIYHAQQNYVKTLQKLVHQIEDEVKFGRKAQIDLLKAQSDLQGNLSYLEVIEGNIAISKASLSSLVGVEHIDSIKPIRVSVTKPSYAIDRLISDSDHLKRIEITNLNLKKASKGVDKSRASKLPQVSLNSYYGYNYGVNDESNVHSGEFDSKNNWQIGLNAKWNLFDFGKSDASIQKAKIGKMKADLDRRQALLDLKKSLTEASERIKQEYANYQGNLKQLSLTQKSEKIERVRYKNGVSTINDFLYAKSKTHLAKAKLIESKYNYQKGKYYMNYLLERGTK